MNVSTLPNAWFALPYLWFHRRRAWGKKQRRVKKGEQERGSAAGNEVTSWREEQRKEIMSEKAKENIGERKKQGQEEASNQRV